MKRWIWLALLGCNASGTSTVDLKDDGTTVDQNEEETGVEETVPEPADDPLIGSNWYGERAFSIEGLCEETLIENGSIISDTSQEEALLAEQCPDCIQAFVLSVTPESICDGQIGVSTSTYRATYRVENATPELYFYTATDTGEYHNLCFDGCINRHCKHTAAMQEALKGVTPHENQIFN